MRFKLLDVTDAINNISSKNIIDVIIISSSSVSVASKNY